MTSESDGNRAEIALMRLPVFDKKHRIWGYELLDPDFLGGPFSSFSKEKTAALDLVGGACIGVQQLLDKGKHIILSLDNTDLLSRLPYAFPAEQTTIKVTEPFFLQEGVPLAIASLLNDGYGIAVDNFLGEPGCEELVRSASLLCVDVLSRDTDDVEAILREAAQYDKPLLADGVANREHSQEVKELGFTLFQGPFFKLPESISNRQLTSHETSRLQLLEMFQEKDPDFEKVTETIQADAALSYRLLSYLNSASFDFPQKIGSIHQALNLLGWQNLKNWLQAIILTDMGHKGEDSSEILLVSLQRAKFLESLAHNKSCCQDPDGLFLLGLLSLMDTLLGMPMKKAVQYLPIKDEYASALRRETASPLRPLLLLAERLEEGKRDKAREICRAANLDEKDVDEAFREATRWSQEFFSSFN